MTQPCLQKLEMAASQLGRLTTGCETSFHYLQFGSKYDCLHHANIIKSSAIWLVISNPRLAPSLVTWNVAQNSRPPSHMQMVWARDCFESTQLSVELVSYPDQCLPSTDFHCDVQENVFSCMTVFSKGFRVVITTLFVYFTFDLVNVLWCQTHHFSVEVVLEHCTAWDTLSKSLDSHDTTTHAVMIVVVGITMETVDSSWQDVVS